MKQGDEVIVFADNHPSHLSAWRQKGERFGFTVTTIAQPNPHPGAEYYVSAVTRAISSRTRLVALTHVTSTVGDLLPAAEVCRVARERGVLADYRDRYQALTGRSLRVCPRCHDGQMLLIEQLAPASGSVRHVSIAVITRRWAVESAAPA